MIRRLLGSLAALALLAGAGYYLWQKYEYADRHSIADPIQEVTEVLDPQWHIHPRLRGLDEWQRPPGPLKVALQVGHWQASEAPDEQDGLRESTGTSWGAVTEWETNLAIAEEVKRLLEERGVVVDLLPTTIPPNYWADAFLSIHADGNVNRAVSGFKVAASRLDYTGTADRLAAVLEETYGEATRLREDPNITRTMRGYYAFNWRRYDHSLHPMTPAAIIETGFLTNASDRRVIVNTPEVAALGIARGILDFLGMEGGVSPGYFP